MLNFAIETAREAGQLLLEKFDRGIAVHKKGDINLVTEADLASEALIIERIRSYYPRHSILAEESGNAVVIGGENTWKWIIDPLDGTTNFIHGFPQYAISIALAHRGQIIQAAVYDPGRNELFTASKGGGAFLNERRIRVSKCLKLESALIGTGFPYRIYEHIDTYLAIFKDLARKSAGIRRPGAAALDLAYVACGRFDGFWEFGLSPWDMAGGVLLISEAGGLVGDLAGNESYLESGNIVAGNPKIFAQLLQLIDAHRSAALRA